MAHGSCVNLGLGANPILDEPRAPGYVFPSWRDALLSGQDGVTAAYDRRRAIFKAANEAGISMRAIAEVVGISPAGVNKVIGRKADRDVNDLLASPARVGEQEN